MSNLRDSRRQAILLIASSGLVLVLIAAAVGWQSLHASRLDPLTHCPLDRAPVGETAILLDATDPLTRAQEGRLLAWLRAFGLTELSREERVEVWTLGEGEDGALARRFCGCALGREQDPIFHNPAMVAAETESLFSFPLRETVLAATTASSSRRSPILEAVAELTDESGLAERSLPRRLVLVSDLEQNSDLGSFYRRVPRFEGFHTSAAYSSVRADLRNITVEILCIPRPHASLAHERALREFWRSYFNSCGARDFRFERL